MFDTATIPVGGSGTGRRSWNLPGAFQIAGVTIDNPSGSWLFIPQDNTFIPPYTLGFAHSFAPTISRIDILFANGPSGQVSTQLGDPVTVYIFDTPVLESAGQQSTAGASFIQGFTPVQAFSISQVLLPSSGALQVPYVAGIANRRHRILSCSVNLIGLTAGGGIMAGNQTAPGFFFVLTSPGAIKFAGLLTPEEPNFFNSFPNGLDCEIGAAVEISLGTYYAGVQFNSTLTVQTI